MPTNDEQKKGLGCWFYGCLTTVILFFLFVGVVGFAAWKLTTYALEKFTDSTPMTFSAQNYSANTAEATRRKIEAFSLLLEQQQPEPAALILTQDELNAFLLISEGMMPNKAQAEVELHDNKVSGKISLPLDDMLPFSLGKGRYLNGAAALNAFTRDGKLFVFIKSLEVKGQKMPEYIMKELGTINMAEKQAEATAENATPPEFEITALKIQEGQISVSMKKAPK